MKKTHIKEYRNKDSIIDIINPDYETNIRLLESKAGIILQMQHVTYITRKMY